MTQDRGLEPSSTCQERVVLAVDNENILVLPDSLSSEPPEVTDESSEGIVRFQFHVGSEPDQRHGGVVDGIGLR